ncbi:MAG: MurR/RpiR family transcriptional regulator [Anaerolineae bacterium]
MARGDGILDMITAAFPDLPRGQRQVARFIVDNGTFVAFASATELAEQAGVSAATVVRFCQAMGYDGYPHLRAAVRERFRRSLTTAQRLEERLRAPIPRDDLLAQVFRRGIQNIKFLMEQIDPRAFEAAIDEFGRANHILVVGGGLSASPAMFLSHSLKVMGFSVQAVTTGGIPLSLEQSALGPDDLLVAFGFWRYFRHIVATMEWAQKRGIPRIAVTDSEVSPLAQLADHAFIATTDGVGHSVSPLASTALVEAFIAALSFGRPKETLAALRDVDAAYRESGLLLED